MRALNSEKLLWKSRGFTLIEMAIVVMILGLVIAGFTPLYRLYLEDKAVHETKVNIDGITAAIGSFRAVNGRYPCPASLTAQRGAPDYGRENCADYNGAINPGTCDNSTGLCRETSLRTTDFMNPYAPGFPVIPNGNPVVRVGAIPFRELNLPEKGAYDGYDSRIVYAVTENLMNDITFRADKGGIEIIDDATPPVTLLDPPASAHFLVLSLGKNARGAYNKTGTQTSPCPVAGPEAENCNVALNSRYRFTPHSSNNANEYDDTMTYFTQSEVPLWQFSTAPNQKNSIVQKPGGDVGMNFVAASASFVGSTGHLTTKQAQISGDLRADNDPIDDDATNAVTFQGKIMANNLCPSSGLAGGDCFKTEVLAGEISTGSGMKCPEDDIDYPDPTKTGPYMLGIAKNKPICGTPKLKCAPGQILTGVKANGDLECTANTSCAKQDVNLCGSTLTLNAALSGSPPQTIVAGLTAIQKFACTAGQWGIISSAGVCGCTAQNSKTTNVPCGWAFSGTVTQTSNYICPTAASPRGTLPYWSTPTPPVYQNWMASWTYPAGSSCHCVGATDEYIPYCAPNHLPRDANGAIVTKQTRSSVCTSALGGGWTPWSPAYTCQCNPPSDTNPQTQTVLCGGNSDPGATKTQKRTYIPATCGWTAWVDDDISACICTTTWSETRVEPTCPAGEVGTVTNKYTYDCTGTPKITPVTDTCAAPPPVTCYWKPNGSSQFSTNRAGPQAYTVGNPPCTCNENAPQCHTGSNGNFQIYQNCTCGG
jgi:prepilin-type N-terminal cleavage/methylation domain-containing protein